MRHGNSHRTLSRPSAHRMLMLRNIVSSLLQHQQIKTTLAKAKEAAPLVDKMITLAKKGTAKARSKIQAFVLNPNDTLPLLFTSYAPRYASRPGGYTRIHKFGHRFGDNAPMAILELVDNPRDLRFEMTARAVGRETLGYFVRKGEREREREREGEGVRVPELELAGADADADAEGGGAGRGKKPTLWAQGVPEAEALDLASVSAERFLRPATKLNRAKVLRYRGEAGASQLNAAARGYVTELLNEPEVLGGLRRARPRIRDGEIRLDEAGSHVGKKVWAGERLSGMGVHRVGLGIAKGVLGGERGWGARQRLKRDGWEKPAFHAAWSGEREGELDRELEELEVERELEAQSASKDAWERAREQAGR